MAETTPFYQSARLVTVFGASGFLGSFVVRALARRGYRVRAAMRRPNLAGHLQPLGVVGQVHAVQANLRYPESVHHAVRGADAVINLVGILQEGGRQSFAAVQAEGAQVVAQAALGVGAPLIHVSAIGADPDSSSLYARSKAAGEAAALATGPDAVVIRPSILFGNGDSFFTRFAALARALPVLPIAYPDTRFQPVHAADVADVIARAVDGAVPGGRVYELGGPEVKTFRELVEYVVRVTGRKKPVIALPPRIAGVQAGILETLDRLTFGLMPDEILLTRDQLALLQRDNVVSEAALREGRTFEGLGVVPTVIEAVVPAYLVRFRRRGQFDQFSIQRNTNAS